MKRKNTAVMCVLLALTFFPSCDTQRLGQFAAFATAGSQYVTAFHQLTAQAGSAMIAIDSVVLITAHNQVSSDLKANPSKYESEVVSHDQLLQTYLANLQLLDEHATQLGSYFDAISNLADGKAASGTSAAATDLLNSIEALSPSVAKATFLGKSVQDYVTTGTPLVVAHFEVTALDDQLKKAAPVIDTALSLQEAAVAAIGSQLKASLGDTLSASETNEVVDPYLQTTELPANWNTNREAFLRAKVTLGNLDSAQAAIKQLHITFKQLVEDKNASIDLTTLLNDITKMAGYANSLESSLKSSNSK
ncbi:MAG TPA: hypothetical protein VN861_17950 [Candidatus Acidoferrales bacterium]|nr:hypothetical protein [Candidatus Acidoferrales bacterium]